jgi:hypothetical protein
VLEKQGDDDELLQQLQHLVEALEGFGDLLVGDTELSSWMKNLLDFLGDQQLVELLLAAEQLAH